MLSVSLHHFMLYIRCIESALQVKNRQASTSKTNTQKSVFKTCFVHIFLHYFWPYHWSPPRHRDCHCSYLSRRPIVSVACWCDAISYGDFGTTLWPEKKKKHPICCNVYLVIFRIYFITGFTRLTICITLGRFFTILSTFLYDLVNITLRSVLVTIGVYWCLYEVKSDWHQYSSYCNKYIS